MTDSRICHVVAAARNGVIGREGALPWRLKDDLAIFKKITTGHPVVMGRKTMEALGKPLPGRTNIVITRNPEVLLPGFVFGGDIPTALDLAQKAPGNELICIIGGGQIYAQTMGLADILYVSRVDVEPHGDAHYPEIPAAEWKLTETESYPANDRNEHAFTFQVWERT